ncbi:MAG TPA: hypothetical protein P5567_08720 [Kiritimatiellia bacterium]|nr:hypothetical protein [Kiritimatiellia bacterium]HSA17717.1 hypothetical protein [Kiritimatiellia bacterium]
MTVPIHIVSLLWKQAHARLTPEEGVALKEALRRHPEWEERAEEIRQTDRILHELVPLAGQPWAEIEDRIVQQLAQEESATADSPEREQPESGFVLGFREWWSRASGPPLAWAAVAALVILAGFIGIYSAPVVGWERARIELAVARGEEGAPPAARLHDPQLVSRQLSILERSLKRECRRAGIKRAAWFRPAWKFKASVRELPTGWLSVVIAARHEPSGLQKEWENFFKDEGELARAVDGLAGRIAGELAREAPPKADVGKDRER